MTQEFPAMAPLTVAPSTEPPLSAAFSLRAATAADLPILSELEQRIFAGDAWSDESLAAEVLSPEPFGSGEACACGEGGVARHALIGSVEEDVVGYAFLRTSGDVAEILRVSVSTAHRRRGFATALIETLLHRAASAGCARVLLEVSAANAAAIACYTNRGFSCVHRRPRYYADGSDALVLRTVLPVWSTPASTARSRISSSTGSTSRRWWTPSLTAGTPTASSSGRPPRGFRETWDLNERLWKSTFARRVGLG